MKPFGEWGIDLLRFNGDFSGFWRKSIIWKLVLINALVMGVVIWLTGVSVKDFACLLVSQTRLSNEINPEFFKSTMQDYLIRASILAVAAAAIIHYFFARRIVIRIRKLAASTRELAKGKKPEPIKVQTSDEIGQLTRDFNQMVQTLKQMEESRKQMISDISHDLRTPLSNINGYLEALSEGIIEGNKEIYRSLHEESVHLVKLVDQLHQLSAWEAKKLHEAELRQIEVPSFIKTSIQQFELEFKKKKIRYSLNMPFATVLVDPIGFKQIINNLIKNAIQYNTGEVIEIRGELTDTEYRIMVNNTGRAIPFEKANRVFERFYRLEPSRNRETGGSGLGLAIVKEIVERHGGEVGVNTDGKHHSFWFTLPVINL
ncbi:ATP-binding protein [Paenibacillus filicis]|uniref:histidine kinase n=1 Tax=Paenibacillus gyeongsangnamensis TaxID=3388067 RepID=A0ABT4Q9Y3_9BACL|nr:ATP-binding protein [Paenibacillus filicis]MCZ8513694.1 ATP-binding protein [Paenibacillus filicis]